MIKFRRGFKEHYLLSYKNLFLNKRKTLGLNSQIELFRRKKTYYKTLNNELQYFNNKDGGNLKAPSKTKGNKRRKSFCSRMCGMKGKNTSSKTARDPQSRINKSLRAWNCGSCSNWR